jgi:hypothetical protein
MKKNYFGMTHCSVAHVSDQEEMGGYYRVAGVSDQLSMAGY